MKNITANYGKLFGCVLLCVFILAVTSCLEITQHVSMNGTVMRTQTRITVQKSLLAMAEAYGGDLDESDFDFTTAESIKVPPKLAKEFTKIDSELEYGVSLVAEYTMNEAFNAQKSMDNAFFLPVKQGNTLVFDIMPSAFDRENEYEDLTLLILAAYKYRLYISKSVLANPQTVTITRDDFNYDALLINYPDFTAVEIPILVFFGDEPFQIIIK